MASISSCAQLFEVIAPPLRHLDTFWPICRLVVNPPDGARHHVGKRPLDRIGVPFARFIEQHLVLVVVHPVRRGVDGIVADRPGASTHRGEHIFSLTGKLAHALEDRQRLTRLGDGTRLSRFSFARVRVSG